MPSGPDRGELRCLLDTEADLDLPNLSVVCEVARPRLRKGVACRVCWPVVGEEVAAVVTVVLLVSGCDTGTEDCDVDAELVWSSGRGLEWEP